MNQQHTPKAAGGPAPPARGASGRAPRRPAQNPAQNPARNTDQKMAMSDGEFTRLADRVQALTGIVLPLYKRQLVISRLRKRLRSLGLDGFGAYLAYLASPAGEAATGEMINVITTNLTAFFREGHHFDDMARILAPRPGAAGKPRRRRIWSAPSPPRACCPCACGCPPANVGLSRPTPGGCPGRCWLPTVGVPTAG